ncbi:DUF2272 domain-containing protein [Deinococcus metallilatus]|uniref:DUF2272 domain-containing protein n=1 Tax=Deinococcus metallilatus TaxID=1211322 RepID=A0AAJ5F491_9DEIO|nr:DUF2272 domain-containing protein [Deinococcus metallilatus]MBB5294512.1 peptidoglycan hydrolase-like protein with peptidoglycan-binding domain [Deinococcus metallilatus]QBY07561.1 DUF2272 domain-containing protein [Deinococcus metallilatus]RXJ13977.1 DUF2272 domain-containing protein [Deinococcus metallilatus]TLK29942.1 DUF2272 domain-containing protein [Deinococcus metallilatus]GMA15727.1 hypothetical protein GCM10025871_20580 [Deinococcus metallilatus]
MTLSPPPLPGRPRALALGAVHPAVGEVQTKLNEVHARELAAGRPGLPFAPLTVDMLFGPRTRAAVLEFQRRVFVDPGDHDGVVGLRTWAQLDAFLAGAPPLAPPDSPPRARPVPEVRRDALALLRAHVPSTAGDGVFDVIAKDYGAACLRHPVPRCGTTCGFLPHWLLWRLGCQDREIVNRAEPGGYVYRPGQNIRRLWNLGQLPFVSALNGELAAGQRPGPGDIVFIRGADNRSEHVCVFLEEVQRAGRTFWRSADAGQREGGLECARERERELVLGPRTASLRGGQDRTVIGWLSLAHLNFGEAPAVTDPPRTTGEADAESSATADLSDAFFAGMRAVGAALDAQPLHLLQVMMAESGIRADAHNAHGHASGLIQFMPATLLRLGWTAGHEAFRRLSAEEQLPFVERFYRPYKRYSLNSTARLYQATFLPATLAGGSDPDTVLTGRDGPYPSAYAANSGLDRRRDGTIRVSDLTAAVDRRCRGPRWEEARARLEGASPLPPAPIPPVPVPPGPTPPGPGTRPTLRAGAQGEAVREAQHLLNVIHARELAAGRPALPGAPLAEDGAFGQRTRAVTVAFQQLAFPGQPREHDGVIGSRTWARLDEWAGGAGPSPQPPPPQPVPPTPPPGDPAWTQFKADVVRIALEEDARWHPGGAARSETDPAMRPVLRGYWMDGAGLGGVAADRAIDDRTPWSAAFISWVMRRAGAGDRFRYAAGHTVYCAAAKRNRLRGDLANPFWLSRITEVAPQPGDLVCTGRQDSGVTFENVDDGQARPSHCDIVVEAAPGRLTVIGGNVGNTVGRKLIRVDERGLVLTDGGQRQYYAVLRVRTDPTRE